jgi:hypothetical protein
MRIRLQEKEIQKQQLAKEAKEAEALKMALKEVLMCCGCATSCFQ